MRWHSWMTHKPGISLLCKGQAQVNFEKVTHLLTQFIIALKNLIKAPSNFMGRTTKTKIVDFWVLFTLKPTNTQRFWFLLYYISPMRVTGFMEEDTSNTVSIWVLHLIKAPSNFMGRTTKTKIVDFWVLFTLKPTNTQRLWFLLYYISPMRVTGVMEEDTSNTVDD